MQIYDIHLKRYRTVVIRRPNGSVKVKDGNEVGTWLNADEYTDVNKPFGNVPTAEELRFYGVRVCVKPRNQVEEKYAGTVERVLNSGTLVEVRPDGMDGTFRVPGERIERETT